MENPVDLLERMQKPIPAETVLDELPDGILLVDMDSNGTITLVNKEAGLMFGYGKDELIGKSLETLIPDRYKGIHRHHREGYNDEPRVRNMGEGLELFCLRKDGRELPVEIRLAPISVVDRNVVVAVIRRKKKNVGEQL